MADDDRPATKTDGLLRRAWRNFVTSGLPGDESSPLIRRIRFLNLYVLITTIVCLSFGPVNLTQGRVVPGVAEVAIGVLGVCMMAFMRWSKRVEVAQIGTLSLAWLLMVVLLFTGGIEKTGIFWWYCLPPGAFFLLGRRRGWWLVLASLVVFSADMALIGTGRLEGPYTLTQLRQFLISYIVLSFIMAFYESVRDDSAQLIERQSREVLETNALLSLEVGERRRYQADLEAARQAADQANAAKSEFLSRMSHELRTPMNSILGFSQLLEMDAREPLTPTQRENVNQILASGRHLLTLINEVLDLSRIEAGRIPLELQPVALSGLVAECLAVVRPLAEQRGVFLRDETGQAPGLKAVADPGRLKQVLLNLLSNAIKYNKPDGLVLVQGAAEGGVVLLSVTDSGVGIPGDKQNLVFEPFQRLAAEHTGVEGTGIGLAIAKKLVGMMSGTIEMKSTPGLGSCFTVRLPAAAESAVEALPQAPAAAAGAAEGAGSVLYVEDEPSNLTLVRHVLGRRPGVALLAADRGSEGLQLARAHKPDLILLDVHLPDMEGHEIFARLREDPETRDIPVVIVSASAMPDDIQKLREAGVDGYLTKPLNVQEFLTTLDGFLGRTARGERPESQGGPA
jgi:signal transduction histidine kinase/CheY-like chemotaxis protein